MNEPLFTSTPTLIDPASGTRAWFFDEVCTAVEQTFGNMTIEVANFLTGRLESEVQRRYVKQGKKVLRARLAQLRHLRLEGPRADDQLGPRFPGPSGSSLRAAKDASPFVRIAAATGISLLRVARMRVELVEDLGPIVRELSALKPSCEAALVAKPTRKTSLTESQLPGMQRTCLSCRIRNIDLVTGAAAAQKTIGRAALPGSRTATATSS